MPMDLPQAPQLKTRDPGFNESREALARYIEWVGEFLMRIAEYRNQVENDKIPYFEPDLTEGYYDAWNEFDAQDHIGRVSGYLRGEENLDRLEMGLYDHGLMGRQLAFKMGLTAFYTAGLRNAFGKRARAMLSQLLATINSLLKSILNVVPGGGAIEEIKQGIENIRFIEDDAGID